MHCVNKFIWLFLPTRQLFWLCQVWNVHPKTVSKSSKYSKGSCFCLLHVRPWTSDLVFDLRNSSITIASGNPNKVAEIKAMLGPLPIEVKKQPSSLDVEETGKTYLENAILKAKAAAAITNSLTIADDSGLEIDSLGNAPGIFSARLADTNEKKIEKILTALGDSPYRSAKVCSVMVLCNNHGEIIKNTTGICWGEILKKPAYPNGEFESLFWVRETNCTYGELSNSQLSKLGSRGKAARELAPFLLKAIGIKSN